MQPRNGSMKSLILLTISVGLVGCVSTPDDITPPKPIVKTQYVYPDCDNPPRRSKVEFKPIYWNWAKDQSGNTIYYLTPEGYEDLSFNTSEIIKGSKELKAELTYYITCIKEAPNE